VEDRGQWEDVDPDALIIFKWILTKWQCEGLDWINVIQDKNN